MSDDFKGAGRQLLYSSMNLPTDFYEIFCRAGVTEERIN